MCATALTLEAAQAFDGPVWLITAKEEGPIAEVADDPRFATNSARMENLDALTELMDAVLVTRTKQEWIRAFDAGRGAARSSPSSAWSSPAPSWASMRKQVKACG